MVCTYCDSKTQVTNSRHQKKPNNVWRRRACKACGAIFSTIEQVDYEKTWVVQYLDGHYSPFLRDRLFISIYKSCQHRPASLEDALGLTATVTSAAHKLIDNGTLHDQDIAKTVLATLKRFDNAAATHYQAFHSNTLAKTL